MLSIGKGQSASEKAETFGPPKWARGPLGALPPDYHTPRFNRDRATPFEHRLLDFAEKRGFYTGGTEWRNEALMAAALEHKELKEKKKRGAPSKFGNSLLLSVLKLGWDQEASEYIQMTDRANIERLAAGKKALKDRDAIRWIIDQRNQNLGQSGNLFQANRPVEEQVLANRMSAQRGREGKRLRKPRVITKKSK